MEDKRFNELITMATEPTAVNAALIAVITKDGKWEYRLVSHVSHLESVGFVESIKHSLLLNAPK